MRAKKSLGQNFLKSIHTAELLVRSACVKNTDTVVEVGPGKGVITQLLLQKTKKVIAVEKDARMITHLKEKFAQEISEQKLTLVHDDILKFKPATYNLQSNTYKIVGSIPYYITGIFLRTFLSAAEQPETIALIIQKEVALRLCSGQAGQKKIKESILSISVKAYGSPRYIKTISRKLFSPEPTVDSAIIVIEHVTRAFFSDISEELFFKLVKAGFGSKRKKVISNIKKQFPKINWEIIFAHTKISLNARAENLTPLEWRSLAKNI